MRKGGGDQGTSAAKTVGILLGAAIGVAVSLLVIFVAAFSISCGWLPEDNGLAAVIAACLLGSLAGSAFALARGGGKRLITALLTAGAMMLLLLVAGVLFYQEPAPPEKWLASGAGCLCGGALMGLLGPKPKKKRRK